MRPWKLAEMDPLGKLHTRRTVTCRSLKNADHLTFRQSIPVCTLSNDVVPFIKAFRFKTFRPNLPLQVRLKRWRVQEAGGLETQLLAGHDGFAELDPLAHKDVHAAVVQLQHSDVAEGMALGALDVSWSRARCSSSQSAL